MSYQTICLLTLWIASAMVWILGMPIVLWCQSHSQCLSVCANTNCCTFALEKSNFFHTSTELFSCGPIFVWKNIKMITWIYLCHALKTPTQRNFPVGVVIVFWTWVMENFQIEYLVSKKQYGSDCFFWWKGQLNNWVTMPHEWLNYSSLQ